LGKPQVRLARLGAECRRDDVNVVETVARRLRRKLMRSRVLGSMATTLPVVPTLRAANREKYPSLAPTSTKTMPGFRKPSRNENSLGSNDPQT